MSDFEIVENYYYYDFTPTRTYVKNIIGYYKYLFKNKMKDFKTSIYEWYKKNEIEPLQNKCNELIKENFYLKKELEYYKIEFQKFQNAVRIKKTNKTLEGECRM